MYMKNRQSSNEIKAFGSYQTLCFTESSMLRNRLLFIYLNVMSNLKNRQK